MVRDCLMAWGTLALIALMVTSAGAAAAHFLDVRLRFSAIGALGHALRYGLLPVTWLVLRLITAALLIGLPLQLILIRRRLAVVLPALVIGLIAYLSIAFISSPLDCNALWYGGFDRLDMLWPPTSPHRVLPGLIAGTIAAFAGLWLAAGCSLLGRRWVRRTLWSLAAVWTTLAVAALGSPFSTVTAGEGSPPNVLLICMDTLRADHLGVYGYHRATSPHIDRLAANGVVFDSAISQAPWTLPSHMSLFTGLYPEQHGLTDYTLERDEWQALSPEVPLLAEVLQQQGYVTAAFTGGGFMDPAFGFARGFDMYRTDGPRLEEFHGAVVRWLRRHRNTRFFLFLQFYNCHRPYQPPEPFSSTFSAGDTPPAGQVVGFCADAERSGRPPSGALLSAVMNHYDGEILYADSLLGELFNQLEALDLSHRTLIVFLSDHGEEFFEHGNCDHIKSLYTPALRVPLIMSGPGFTGGRRVPKLIELREVGGLMLGSLGLIDGSGGNGSRPRPLAGIPEEASDTAHLAFAETCCQGYAIRRGRWFYKPWRNGIHSVQDACFKLVADARGQPLELYDLRQDPGEQVNLLSGATGPLIPEAEQASGELQRALSAHLSTLQSERRQTIGGISDKSDDDATERLRSLGYIDR